MKAAGPLFRLSRRRLTARPFRTCMSVLAVAAAVAFVFAIQAINIGPESSYRELEHALGGQVDRYLVARNEHGVSATVFQQVARTPTVIAAAPMTQQLVRLESEKRTVRAGLIGADRRLRAFDPPASDAELNQSADLSAIGVYLPRRVARQLSVTAGDKISVHYGANTEVTFVAGLLSGRAGDSMRNLSVALAPLGLAQRLTGTEGRITRILLKFRREPTTATVAALNDAADGAMDVTEVGSEAKMLARTSMVERTSASLFAALTLLIGGLLVFNAAALNALERHRDVTIMRMLGGSRRVILVHAGLEALAIGVVGSVIGLIAGRLMLELLIGSGPQYLAGAYLVNAGVIVPSWLVAASLAAGSVTAVVGATIPTALQLRGGAASLHEHDAMSPTAHPTRSQTWPGAVAAAAAVGAGLVIAVVAPRLTPAGIVLIVVGSGLAMPSIVRGWLRLAHRIMPRSGHVKAGMAELYASPGRATALASICALCICALVVIGGTAHNLKIGGAALANSAYGTADLWLSVASPENLLTSEGFDRQASDRFRNTADVRKVLPYRFTFLDFHGRRVMTIGYAPYPRTGLTGAEFIRGDRLALANGLPRDGDVAVSDVLARSIGLRLGQRFVLPTPTGPERVRYVATVSNYGWQSGAITMGGRFMDRAWGDGQISLAGLQLKPGSDVLAAQARLTKELGASTPFRIETKDQGIARMDHTANLGLARMRQIAIATLIGALLAITAGSLTAIAQRRRHLACLRVLGMSRAQTRGLLGAELGFVLVVGAIVGIALGVAVQALIVRWSFMSAGYPITFSPNLGTFLTAAAALSVMALTSIGLSARSVFRHPIVESLAAD